LFVAVPIVLAKFRMIDLTFVLPIVWPIVLSGFKKISKFYKNFLPRGDIFYIKDIVKQHC